ncbi:HNH endonuclease [Sphingomonas olei]|uniref:HNH endonuclease n=1 Tax=Sphingomonas olei TaxID=1886787 RepID=A0ABY2QIC4_9SPHN|nr:HNH endonuclease signature motif containing protein [Sphingomonas olei]THG40431.1 HNH endonuclease [Sphingomonas olei]
MPTQPPQFGGSTPRKAWSSPHRLKPTPRKRGRAGQRDRAEVIAEEPFCRECLKNNRATPTAIVDHIKPLAWGGSDARSNKQGLCVPCHDLKSASEREVDRRSRG